jgi:hypothetical protein
MFNGFDGILGHDHVEDIHIMMCYCIDQSLTIQSFKHKIPRFRGYLLYVFCYDARNLCIIFLINM